MAEHNELGIQGEAAAIRFLQAEGYTILESNWRYQKAEIDIIACKGPLLVIAEVKTRSSADFGEPEEAVTDRKQGLLIQAAEAYVIEKELDLDVRFDIIAILKKGQDFQIKHIPEAFLPGLEEEL